MTPGSRQACRGKESKAKQTTKRERRAREREYLQSQRTDTFTSRRRSCTMQAMHGAKVETTGGTREARIRPIPLQYVSTHVSTHVSAHVSTCWVDGCLLALACSPFVWLEFWLESARFGGRRSAPGEGVKDGKTCNGHGEGSLQQG